MKHFYLREEFEFNAKKKNKYITTKCTHLILLPFKLHREIRNDNTFSLENVKRVATIECCTLFLEQ